MDYKIGLTLLLSILLFLFFAMKAEWSLQLHRQLPPKTANIWPERVVLRMICRRREVAAPRARIMDGRTPFLMNF